MLFGLTGWQWSAVHTGSSGSCLVWSTTEVSTGVGRSHRVLWLVSGVVYHGGQYSGQPFSQGPLARVWCGLPQRSVQAGSLMLGWNGTDVPGRWTLPASISSVITACQPSLIELYKLHRLPGTLCRTMSRHTISPRTVAICNLHLHLQLFIPLTFVVLVKWLCFKKNGAQFLLTITKSNVDRF